MQIVPIYKALKFNFYLFIYLWLCWVVVSVRGLSPVAASGGHSSSWCAGLSLLRPLLLRSTGSRHAGSAIVAHGPSRSTTCGIFPDRGSNPCPLHWQADSQPLRHQGSPSTKVQKNETFYLFGFSEILQFFFSEGKTLSKNGLLVTGKKTIIVDRVRQYINVGILILP